MTGFCLLLFNRVRNAIRLRRRALSFEASAFATILAVRATRLMDQKLRVMSMTPK